jgi:hypothetical protein
VRPQQGTERAVAHGVRLFGGGHIEKLSVVELVRLFASQEM